MATNDQPVTFILRSKDPLLLNGAECLVDGIPVGVTSVQLDAEAGRETKVTLGLVPWDGMNLELPAHVTVNVTVDPGMELIVGDTEDGEKRYVCRPAAD